ncbi:enoyl-CoA hydratase/isomerase family protein [Tunicatimonas pelagia]|uniref:enoyl-CoA hydratase/isomerase family protein n=1 Tax=Tunicatimonas pelagia TaxID=931531 RepID=UPI0026659853|nr:enoyl-CoA hydratase-related protein [Tunicatimonas pelagia]WKN42512.1 enoyl-CoA hydratase-related protein [Tunicatimonas pelagia]
MFQHIIYEVSAGIGKITLNRPEVYNALNNQIKVELKQAFSQVQEDSTVRAVILTGGGSAFCSGQDLKAAQTELKNTTYSEAVRTYYNPLILAMRDLPKPIICQLNGVAAGAGCSLALACDVIVASDDASLAELFVGIGLVMDSGSTYFLPRMVGSLRAFELASTGRTVSAEEAVQIGLANQVVPADQLENTVNQLAQKYAQAPTKTIGMIKQMLNQSYEMSLAEVLDYEAQIQDQAAATEDHQEGILAFLEKRKPKFRGK